VIQHDDWDAIVPNSLEEWGCWMGKLANGVCDAGECLALLDKVTPSAQG